MSKRYLDLGGTAHDSAQERVAITLDGTTAADGAMVVIGDFNAMPFANNVFDEAYGGCYLEGGDTYEDLPSVKPGCNFNELARVLKHNGVALVGACGEIEQTVAMLRSKASKTRTDDYLPFADLDGVFAQYADAVLAGFSVKVRDSHGYLQRYYDYEIGKQVIGAVSIITGFPWFEMMRVR